MPPTENHPQKTKWYLWWMFIIIIGITYIIIAASCFNCQWMGSWLQVGGTIITLGSAVIIMLQNNERSDASTQEQIKALQASTAGQMEHVTTLTNLHIQAHRDESKKQMDTIRESTKEQIQNFVDQTDEITTRLEEVAKILVTISKLSGDMLETEKELKEIEAKKFRLREEELEKQQEEFQETVERHKPLISYRLEDATEFIFWHFLNVFIHNGGGDATSIRFNITLQSSLEGKPKKYSESFINVKRGQQVQLQTGRTKSLKNYDIVIIEISVWDIHQREYSAFFTDPRTDNQWMIIHTKEQRLLI